MEIESLYRDVARIDEQAAAHRLRGALRARHKESWRTLLQTPRWAKATAALVILALVVSSVTDLTPAARADSLLTKAAEEQGGDAHSPRFLRVQGAAVQCGVSLDGSGSSRLEAVSGTDFCTALSSSLKSVGWNWNDLLSARSFQHWRHSLKKKKDSIQTFADATEVTTTTSQGPLEKATLRIRNADHRPVSGRLVFASLAGAQHQEIEVSEAATVPQELAHDVAPVTPEAPHSSSLAPPTVADPLSVREMAVRLALHRMGADDNILLEVTRSGDAIKVTGVVPTQELKARLASELSPQPQVILSVSAEGEPQPSGSASEWQSFRGDAAPLAYNRINALYAENPEGRRRFVNGLDATTRRLVGEAKSKDALLRLASLLRGTESAVSAAKAATDLEDRMAADTASLALQLQPILGPLPTDSKHLTYSGAMQLYTLVHEVVLLNRRENTLTLEECALHIRGVLTGRK
ncbi:MAG: hypothetical protein P4M01_06255 [Acidobacteriota bacterium]|nr:hypothetical protein [Acidobacteriota bacterium]